jgi:hypothetical protein
MNEALMGSLFRKTIYMIILLYLNSALIILSNDVDYEGWSTLDELWNEFLKSSFFFPYPDATHGYVY